jgi:hypothetical protein
LAVAAVMVTVQRQRWYGKMDMSDNKYVEREDVRKRRRVSLYTFIYDSVYFSVAIFPY